MPEHSIELQLPWSCEQLFELASDIEDYPDFLPGWKRVTILRRLDNGVRVRQELGLGLFRQAFVSEAEFQRPHSVRVHSSDGPFKSLEITWRFNHAGENLSEITFSVSYSMKKRLMERMSRVFFEQLVDDVVSRFRRQARKKYGPGAS